MCLNPSGKIVHIQTVFTAEMQTKLEKPTISEVSCAVKGRAQKTTEIMFPLTGEANQLRCAPNRGMVRGRGCNDSFRAAVDRSYEGPKNDTGTMETRKLPVILISTNVDN